MLPKAPILWGERQVFRGRPHLVGVVLDEVGGAEGAKHAIEDGHQATATWASGCGNGHT